ncbi:hypothetical protein BJF93_12320 [Xaviernesmea oryzae]|uniref:Uncharacterized protein n=2 Tax=Xaviernesmea oryzae TaxID=464029 RepID=A0A1Q9AVJ2_9HYPH|nr:hypothetical protein BJF93_12320 [Xaviernesmea oryzae]
MTGHGRVNHTAWAADGEGVLAIDVNGDNKIDGLNEIDFKAWDPSAKSDLEAIAHLFDSNHDGKLDANDAVFSKFRVLVDGKVLTLAQAGVASINLMAFGAGQTFADGSKITGTTTFIKTDGTTGLAGDATFAFETSSVSLGDTSASNNGKTVETLVETDDSGVKTKITTVTTYSDANGAHSDFAYDTNADGVVDAFMTDVTKTSGSTTTETQTNYGTDNVVVTSRVTTVTTTDASKNVTITTSVDTDGDGHDDTVETYVQAATGATSNTTSHLNRDGSIAGTVKIAASADGLTKTTSTDHVGAATSSAEAFDKVVTDVIQLNPNTSASSIETVTTASSNGKTLEQTVKTVSADRATVTRTLDADGDGTIDSTSTAVTISTNAGTTVTAQKVSSDGSLMTANVQTTSTDGLTITTSTDDFGLKSPTGAVAYLTTTVDATTLASDGGRKETITTKWNSGAVASSVSKDTSADKKTITTHIDTNGDGRDDQTIAVVPGSAGAQVTTVSNFAHNRALIRQAVSTTSADGISVTTDVTLAGSGIGATEHSDITVVDAASNRVRTVKDKSANGTLLDVSQTTTSSNGLSVLSKSDSRGLTGSSGIAVFDHTTDLETTVAAGVKTVATTVWWGDQNLGHNGANTKLLSSATIVTSADHQTVTTSIDSQGDGKADVTVVAHVNDDGSTTTKTTQAGYNLSTKAAVMLSQRESIKSANGLSTTTWTDETGTGAYNRRTTDNIVYNSDGSKTELTDLRVVSNAYNAKTLSNTNTTLVSSTSTTVSGNNLSKIAQYKAVGSVSATSVPSYVTQTSDDETTINVDGGQTEVVTNWYGAQNLTHNASGTTLKSVTKTVTSSNGLSKTVWTDINGAVGKSATDFVYNEKDTDVVTYDVDSAGGYTGATTETISVFAESGSLGANKVTDLLVSKAITKISADKSVVAVTQDIDGDGVVDKRVTKSLQADGSQITISQDFVASWVAARDKTVLWEAANGLRKTTQYFGLSNGSNSMSLQETVDDLITLGADDSQTETVTAKDAAGNVIFQTATTTHSKTLTSSTVRAQSGVFVSNTINSSTSFADDGTQTAITNNLYGSTLHDSTKTVTSADGTSVEIDRDVDGNGKNDWIETSQVRADGSKLETVKDYAPDGITLKDQVTYLTWSDSVGTHKTTQRDTTGKLSSGAAVFDQTVTDTSVLTADGGSIDTVTYSDASNTVVAREVTQQSIGGLNVKQQFYTGAADSTLYRTVTKNTVVNTDGSQTVSETTYDAASHLQFRTLISTDATGLKVTRSWDTAGSGTSYDQVETDNTALNADGSRTEVKTDMNGGKLLSQSQTTTSANGLTVTKLIDVGGTGAYTVRRVDKTVNNLDGSHVETITEYDVTGNPNGAGKLKDTVITTASADHLTKTIQRDADGDGIYEQVETITTGIDGSSVENLVDKTSAGVAKGTVNTTISADGLVITTLYDLDADGTTDRTRTETKIKNGDGSQVDTIVELNSDGTLHQKSVLTTSADGLTSTLQWDTNGAVDDNKNAIYNRTQISKTDLSGAVTISANLIDGANNPYTQTTTISADGRIKTVSFVDTLANQYIERYQQVTTNNIDGSQSIVTTDTKEKLVSGTKTDKNTYSDVYVIDKLQSTGVVSADGVKTITTSSNSSSGQFTVTESTFGGKIANGIDETKALSSTGTTKDTTANNIDGVTTELSETASIRTKRVSSIYNNTVVSYVDDGTVDLNGNGDQIILRTNGSVNTGGSGISIDVVGTNATATSSKSAIALEAGIVGFTLNGDLNKITAVGAGDGLTINGTKNSLAMSNGFVTQAANDTLTVTGDTNRIDIQGDDTVTVIGSADNVNASGSRNNVTMSNGAAIVSASSDLTLAGDKNAVTLKGASAQLMTSGSGTTVDMTGSDETVVTSGSTITVESGATTATIQGDGGNAVTVAGSGTTLALAGQSNTVAITNGTLTLGDNGSTTVTGTGNNINAYSAGSAIAVSALGKGNILTASGKGTIAATVADGSTVNATGSSGGVGSLTVTGNNLNINATNDARFTVTGTGATIDATTLGLASASVSGAKVILEANALLNLAGDKNAATLKGSHSQLTTSGSGTTIDMTGSDEIVSTKGSTITVEGGVKAATVQGDGSNAVTVAGSGTTLTLAGQSNTVAITSGTLALVDNTSATVTGTGNNINASSAGSAIAVTALGKGNILTASGKGAITATMANGSTVNATGSSGGIGSLAVTGNNLNINATNDARFTVSGTGATIDAATKGLASASVSGGKITVEEGAILSLAGDKNAVTLKGSYSQLTSSGSGTSIDMTGSDETVTTKGSTITVESGVKTATVLGDGSNAVTVAGSGLAITLTGRSNTVSASGQKNTVAMTSGTLTLGDYSSTTVTGTGNNIKTGDIRNYAIEVTVLDTGNTLTLSGLGPATATVADGTIVNVGSDSYDDQNFTVTGNNLSIREFGRYPILTINGTGATIDAATYGRGRASVSGAKITLEDYAFLVLAGDKNAVTVKGSYAKLSASGDGTTIDMAGSNEAVATKGSTITVESGVTTATVEGDGNTITVAGSGTALTLGGESNTVAITNGALTLDGFKSSTTVTGTGNSIIASAYDAKRSIAVTALGTGTTLTALVGVVTATVADGSTVNVGSSPTSMSNVAGNLTVAGNNLNIKEFGTSHLTVNGTGATIDAATRGYAIASVSGGKITLEEGASLNLAGDKNAVTMKGKGTQLTTSGSGTTIDMTGSDETVGTIGSSTVTVESGVSTATVGGDGNTIAVAGSGTALTLANGKNSVAISNGTLILGGSSSTTVTGTGNNIKAAYSKYPITVTALGSGTTLTVLGSEQTTATVADGSTINVSDGYSDFEGRPVTFGAGLTVTGNNLNIKESGSRSSVTVNGTGAIIDAATLDGACASASGATVTLEDHVHLNLAGDKNAVTVKGSYSQLTTSGDGTTIDMTGSDETVITKGSTITVKSGLKTATVLGDGSNAITVAGSGTALTLAGLSNTVAITSGSVTVQSGASVTLTGDGNQISDLTSETVKTSGKTNAIDVASTGSHTVQTSDGSVKLESGASATITGNNDVITLSGNNMATVSGTGETYMFGKGAGQDTIAAASGQNTGVVDFASSLTSQNVWFSQSGKNLSIQILSSNDNLTINNWFGDSPTAPVQSFATTDGSKLDSQVTQLVSAMASYSSHNSGFNPATATQMPTDSTLQNAIAAAWHH